MPERKQVTSLRLSGITACVFDAYGTLFDFTSAAAQEKSALGDQWLALSDLWRTKQLQYTWLRSLMGKHADFWQVTGDALDFAMTSLKIEDPALRDRFGQAPEHIPSPPDGEITTLASLAAIVGMA